MGKKTRRTVVGAAAAGAGMMAALTFTATPASASGVNVDQWFDTCDHYDTNGCLYYSQYGGGEILTSRTYIADLSGYLFASGKKVRNNAASIGNSTLHCGTTTWVYVNAGGDYNWVHAGYGGNLGTNLRNNEASFDPAASCS